MSEGQHPRRGDLEAGGTTERRLDEGEAVANNIGVVDRMTRVKVSAGQDLSPGAHGIEPRGDDLGELLIRRAPGPFLVVRGVHVGYHDAQQRFRRTKVLGDECPELSDPLEPLSPLVGGAPWDHPVGSGADGPDVRGHRHVEADPTHAGGVGRPQGVAHHPDRNRQLVDRRHCHPRPVTPVLRDAHVPSPCSGSLNAFSTSCCFS